VLTDADHPAKFNQAVLDAIRTALRMGQVQGWVVDLNGGVGKIHELRPEFHTFHVEIEPEWEELAAARGPGVCMDLFDYVPDAPIAAIAVSPTFGNRMADQHEASGRCSACKGAGFLVEATPEGKQVQCEACDGTGQREHEYNTYTHKLGRKVSEGSSANLQWGDAYRDFHHRMWRHAASILQDNGLLIVNVKDHIRDRKRQPVVAWHKGNIAAIPGMRYIATVPVPVRGLRQGENHEARVDNEFVLVFQKGEVGSILPADAQIIGKRFT
jgi:hypothetical protein